MNDNKFESTFKRINPKIIHILLLLISVSALATAFIAEYYFNIKPCSFCIFERWGYFLLGIISFIGLWSKHDKRMLYVQFLSVFIGLFLATYHIAIQEKWVKLPEVCKTTQRNFKSLEELKASLKNRRPPCNKVTWEIFGIPATWYNLVLYVGLIHLLGGYVWLYRKR